MNEAIRQHAIESGDTEMAQQGLGHRERAEFMRAQHAKVESAWTEPRKNLSNLAVSKWLTETLDRNIARDLDT